jgi:hypothetical protein
LQSYLRYFSRNDSVATRDFSNVVMNEQNPMSRSKGDYSLYCLGTFDGDSGDYVNNHPQNNNRQKEKQSSPRN